MQSEKETEAFLRDTVKALGGGAYKWVSPGCAGVPDRIVILPNGRIFFVELKSEGKTSSARQRKRQAELRALGCTVYADVATKEKVKELLGKESDAT